MKLNRRLWYRWHSLSGLSLSILLCFICLTGTLAVVSHEIDWLFNSALRVKPESEEAKLNWAELYHQANQAYPDAEIRSITAPLDPWFAAEVLAVHPNGKRFRIYINPYSNKFTGTGRWMNWQRYLRQFHRRLMLPTTLGVTLVGSTALLLLISLFSGVVNYRQCWKGFFALPRKKSKRLYWGDTHRLLGVWSLAFILLISATGLWYLGEKWGLSAQYPENEKQFMPADYDTDRHKKNTSKALQLLQQRVADIYPSLLVRQLQMPDFSTEKLDSEAVLFRGQAEAMLVRDRANHVAFDLYTGEHLSTRKAHQLNAHVRISEAADPLHFGTFWGLKSKILWFVFGIALTALIITGTYIYCLRVAVKFKKAALLSALPNEAAVNKPGGMLLKLAWQGMGAGAWVGGMLIMVCLGLAVVSELN